MDTIVQLGDLIGYEEETGEIRNNRPQQVSTKAIIDAFDQGNYDPTVATIRINSASGDCCDGGNTYRAIRTILSRPDGPKSLGVLLLINDDFSFYHYNTLESKRKPSQVLEMACGDGWGKFKEQLFTLGCLRSQSLSVVGGGASGKTWNGKALKDTKSILEVIDTHSFFQFALGTYAKVQSAKSKHALVRIVELVKELVPQFNVDADGAMLLCAMLDETIKGNTLKDLPDYSEVIENMVLTILDPKGISKIQSAWTNIEGIKFNRQARYALLCDLVRCSINKSRIENVSHKVIPNQGIALFNVGDRD
jgi:hypothetical protein